MNASKKILFVVGPALGHVGRSLVIARALARQSDIQIHFACVSPGHGETTIGSEFKYSNIDYNERGGRTFAINLEQVMALECPDLICLDMTPVPWLYQVIFPSTPQVFITNFFLTKLGKETTMQDLWWEKNSEMCNTQRMLRGLDPIDNARVLYERDVVLLADPAPLMRDLGDTPANYTPVGPCLWEAASSVNRNESIAQDYLYISMGSSGNRPISLKHIESLADCIKVNNIIWVGKQTTTNEKGSINFSYEYFDRLTASDVVPNAKLVITQGGAGSTYQALGYGVPVGIWPTHKNHEILSRYIQKNGFGFLITENIQDEILQLCSNIPIFRQNILNAGSGVSFTNAPEKAANAVLEYLRNNQ